MLSLHCCKILEHARRGDFPYALSDALIAEEKDFCIAGMRRWNYRDIDSKDE
ncbi:MAG: hypothetical protein K6E97_04115 [Treponema sp.]|nr:hypothetical protein [Treponema sp.]